MAADKMKEILKHFPDLENGWKEMEEKLQAEPAEREMLSLKYRAMLQMESSKESLVESECTKAKRADSDLKVMKANAPEKIYLEAIYPDNGVLPNGLNYTPSPTDIEYARTDAFIKKACDWFRRLDYDDTIPPYETTEEFIEGFKNYMKGE